MPPAGPVFMGHKKGQTKTGRRKVVIGQGGDRFLWVMDREAITSMSGRHQMDLIN